MTSIPDNSPDYSAFIRLSDAAVNARVKFNRSALNESLNLFKEKITEALENHSYESAGKIVKDFLKFILGKDSTDIQKKYFTDARKLFKEFLKIFEVSSNSGDGLGKFNAESRNIISPLIESGITSLAGVRLKTLLKNSKSQLLKDLFLTKYLSIMNEALGRLAPSEDETLKKSREGLIGEVSGVISEHSLMKRNLSEIPLIEMLMTDRQNFIKVQASLLKELAGFTNLLDSGNFNESFKKTIIMKPLIETRVDKLLSEPILTLSNLIPLYTALTPLDSFNSKQTQLHLYDGNLTYQFLNKFNPLEHLNESIPLNEKKKFISNELQALNYMKMESSSIAPTTEEKEKFNHLQFALASKLIDLMPRLESDRPLYLQALMALKEKAPEIKAEITADISSQSFTRMSVYQSFYKSADDFINSLSIFNKSSRHSSAAQGSEFRDFLNKIQEYNDPHLNLKILPVCLELMEHSSSFTALKENLKVLNSLIEKLPSDRLRLLKQDPGILSQPKLLEILKPALSRAEQDSNNLKILQVADKNVLVSQLEKLGVADAFPEFISHLSRRKIH